jgi:hypothetical protein
MDDVVGTAHAAGAIAFLTSDAAIPDWARPSVGYAAATEAIHTTDNTTEAFGEAIFNANGTIWIVPNLTTGWVGTSGQAREAYQVQTVYPAA